MNTNTHTNTHTYMYTHTHVHTHNTNHPLHLLLLTDMTVKARGIKKASLAREVYVLLLPHFPLFHRCIAFRLSSALLVVYT